MENLSAFVSALHQRRLAAALDPAVILATFAATLFCSALMLFSVQPMFAKMALPALGGTPAVWAVSMCFFQTALLAGYCYAHALNRILDTKTAALVHFGVLTITSIALPIGLPATLAEPPAGDAYLWLLGVLTLGVGLPFFAVSASAPLLQAWFSKTGHKDAADPYFLYGASNLGSLIALLAYPLIVEPVFGLKTQSVIWSGGFVVLALLIAACATLMLMRQAAAGDAANEQAATTAQPAAAPLTLSQRATWVLLAAIPSGLMVGVTTYITTDVASAPFIWVIPLAMFLVTFILVFKDKLAFNYDWVLAALPVAILLHLFMPAHAAGVLAAVVAFFLAAIVCHRELYLRRPAPFHLTEFYIWMSAGGVIGGIFAALAAPQMFATVLEFKLLLLLSLLCRPGVLFGLSVPINATRLFLVVTLMAVAFLKYKHLIDHNYLDAGGLPLAILIALTLTGLFLTRTWPEHRAILVMAMIVGVTIVPSDNRTLYAERSFFGTNRVMATENGQHRIMLHGTTIHGAERVLSDEGKPVVAANPGTYYYPGSPMPRGVAIARQFKAAGSGPLNVGVVGLGTGSLACFAVPGDSWRFYEIDPMVGRIASNPKLFSFLSRCLPNTDIVYGDARLTLQKEPAQRFDYLLIDAFSSDAIPAHLLTREAIASYFDKLAPTGVLALHVSNRFLDIAPVVAATAATMPDVTGVYVSSTAPLPEPDATPSKVVFLTRNPALAASMRTWADAKPLDAGNATAWTDDYSDILSALYRGLRK